MRSSFMLLALPLILLLLFSSTSEGAISCNIVMRDLAPCTSYLRGTVSSPPSACCSGISSLASAASTTADRRAACGCLKTAAQSIKPSPGAASSLASSCGLSLPYTISPNTDCSTIS